MTRPASRPVEFAMRRLAMFERARLRLTAWYVSMLAVILILIDVGVLSIMQSSLQANMADDLERKASQASAAVTNPGSLVSQSGISGDPSWADVCLFAATSSGTVVASSTACRNVLPNRSTMNQALSGHPAFTTVGSGRSAFVAYSQPIYGAHAAGASAAVVGVVQVARSLQTVSDTMTGLISLLLAASVLALMLAFFAGLWLAGRTLRPIRDSLQQQKQFVSDASHELRTPVTVIRTAAEAILRQRTPIDPRVRELAEDIVSESAQLGSLVGDLGVLAEADSRAEMRREPVDVGDLLAAVVQSGKIQAEARAVSLEASIAAAGVIDGDPVRLRQLFGILVDNATKFTPKGETSELRAVVDGQRLRATVIDHGPGIPAAELPRIFERFYRGEAERSREGSGLGLAIAQWIAEGHGGVISVRSVQGRGAEFIVDLPLATAPAATAPIAEEPSG
jgi:signal transduction histidine kinase